MATITERPSQFSFSKNDIRYVFNIADLTPPGLFLQVKLYYDVAASNDPQTLLYGWDLKPDAAGNVYLYIQAYLDNVLNYVMPTIGEKFTNADDQLKKFVIEFREVTDADPDPAWDTSERALPIRVAVKGGIEKNKSVNGFFSSNYFTTTKPFFTWYPSGKYVFDDEDVYLTFFNPGYTTENYQPGLEFVDVTTENGDGHLFSFPTGGYLWHLNLTAMRRSITLSFSTDVLYFDFIVRGPLDELLSASQRFYIEYRPQYFFYDLVYHNSLGGLDFIRVKGDVEPSFNRSYEESEGGFNLNDKTDAVKVHETTHAYILMQRSFKGDAGYQRTKLQQEALSDILFSRSIYQKIFTRWVPVLTVNKSQSFGLNSDKKKAFPLEWTLSESNEVFTPAGVQL